MSHTILSLIDFTHIHIVKSPANIDNRSRLKKHSLFPIPKGTRGSSIIRLYDTEQIEHITLRPGQNGRHVTGDICKWILLNENVWIQIRISLQFVTKGPINNIPALVQIMAWHRPGEKPISQPMMATLPMHICVTGPQWVKCHLLKSLSMNWLHVFLIQALYTLLLCRSIWYAVYSSSAFYWWYSRHLRANSKFHFGHRKFCFKSQTHLQAVWPTSRCGASRDAGCLVIVITNNMLSRSFYMTATAHVNPIQTVVGVVNTWKVMRYQSIYCFLWLNMRLNKPSWYIKMTDRINIVNIKETPKHHDVLCFLKCKTFQFWLSNIRYY